MDNGSSKNIDEGKKNNKRLRPFRKKIQHFWYYYRNTSIVVIIAILFMILLIDTISKNKVKYDAYCLLLNDVNNNQLVERIERDFPIYMKNPKSLISVENGFPFNYLAEFGISWPDESAIVKIMSLDEHKADIAVADYSTMLWAVHENYIYSLDEILPKDLLEKLKPYYEYALFKGADGNDGKIYGLNISDTKVFKGNSDTYDNAVIFVPNLSVDSSKKVQHDRSIELIKYFFELE